MGARDYRLSQEANQGLQRENAGLRARVLMLERTTSLDKQAAVLLHEDLKASQEEIYRLKEELGFYLGVMDATGGEQGLDVHGIRIKPLAYGRGYRLELILIHIAKTEIMLEGMIDVALEGIGKNGTKRLSLSDITIDKGVSYDFSLRSFQRFESNFILPENFKPQRVFINLLVKDKEKSRLEKIFNWSVTTGLEGTNVG